MTMPLRLADGAPLSRDATMSHLERHRVETRPLLAGNLARHPAAQGIESRGASGLGTCDDLLERAFMIGCHPVLSDAARQTLDGALRSLAEV